MRIIHMSDIHGDFESFDKALEIVKASDAEVLAITGDLAGGVFDDTDKRLHAECLSNLNSVLGQVHQAINGRVRTIHDVAGFLLSDKVEVDKKLRGQARSYLELEKTAEGRMLNQYEEFKQRFNDLAQRVLLIPGNWDGKCIDDILVDRNIHFKTKEEINGVEFVGYGGAREHPIELPADLTTNFDEDELYSHLCKHENVEVILTHVVPRGFEGNNNRHPGEYSLLAYLYRVQPSLILTGHTHNPFLIQEEKTRTFVSNSGNLGRYQDENFGTFTELEIDAGSFVKPITQYKVNGDRVLRIGFAKQKVPA